MLRNFLFYVYFFFTKTYRVGRDNGIFFIHFFIKIEVKITDIWKHFHVIELHTVFFTIIETTGRKIVIVTLTKAVKKWEYEDIQLQKTS